jgi:hypothetical protein
MIPLIFSTGMLRMSKRRLVLAMIAASFACCSNACGDLAHAQRQVRDARLSGHVLVCAGIPERCSSVSAAVTILSIRGTKFGKAVSKQYARHGRFSFLLSPGRYFPSADVVGVRLNGGHCIAGEVLIRAHENVNVDISCYTKLARPSSLG